MKFKNVIKRNKFIVYLYLVYKKMRNEKTFRKMSRGEAFSYIYENNEWGGNKGEFYSGEGSWNVKYIEGYANIVGKFIQEHNIKDVCDLGCGDFHVASLWITENIRYIGVDIVAELIESHKRKYCKNNIQFKCLDIVEDELPDADLCIIRQVFQHLSNAEILEVLHKIKKYKYVIVTEHVIEKKYAKINVDKLHGGHIRTYYNSGVYLEEAPFNIPVEIMLKIPYQTFRSHKEELVTVLIKNENNI